MAKPQPKKKTAKRAPKKAAESAPKKAAKAPTAAKKAVRGKRYTSDEKSKVVEFVGKLNLEKGRGGVAAAVREFGVTALTISSWIKRGGKSTAPAKAAAKKGARRPAGRENVLAELVEVQKQITRQKAQLDKLEARFDTLKKSL